MKSEIEKNNLAVQYKSKGFTDIAIYLEYAPCLL